MDGAEAKAPSNTFRKGLKINQEHSKHLTIQHKQSLVAHHTRRELTKRDNRKVVLPCFFHPGLVSFKIAVVFLFTSFLKNLTMVLLSAHPVNPCGWLGSCRNLISRGMVPIPRSIVCCRVRDVQSHTNKRDPYFPKKKKEQITLVLLKGFFLYGLLNLPVLKSNLE